MNKISMANKVKKQDLWVPETPTKPNDPTVNVATISFIHELNGKDQVLEGALESNSSNVFLSTDGTTNPFHSSEDVEFNTSSSSKKKRKNNHRETGDKVPKATKRKIYRPKVVADVPKKRTKKSKAKSNKTPEPSTPKQKKGRVRKVHSCKRRLFNEELAFLPFLNNFKALKVEEGRFENSTVNNELGVGYNSLQSYHKVTSLSSLCLIESRSIRANFPSTCKEKRIAKYGVRLEKFLTPFVKRKRSKSFIRKRSCFIEFNLEGNRVIDKRLIARIKKFRSLKKKKHGKKKHDKSGQLVLYKGPDVNVDVALDEETKRVWNLLLDEKGHEEKDELRRKHWEAIREMYRLRIESFMCCMRIFQGDRTFYPWKGSVLDSVIGAILTQNVSDHLSSSAFMTLASKFPIKTTSCEKSNEVLVTMPDGKELIGHKVGFPSPNSEKEMEDRRKVEDMEAEKTKESSNIVDDKEIEANKLLGKKKLVINKKTLKEDELKEKRQYWDKLKKIHTKTTRHSDHMDSIDWEAVRCAKVSEIAAAIACRGQHNIIAERIQDILNSSMDSNGKVDLEWVRYIPPKDAKEYLLSITGLGLKSVECIRLLALRHIAFPVDVNVGRIVVRLGWVPIKPLPEEIQIHNLEMFPNSNKIQEYLWPRLCNLDQHTLYELHYQLITFGKVFCTKRNPNCNACPMRDECEHYASSVARAKLALPGTTSDQRTVVRSMQADSSFENTTLPTIKSAATFIPEVNIPSITGASEECEPIIEMPLSPEPESHDPDVDYDDDDFYNHDVCGDIEDIPIIKLYNSPKTHNDSPKEYEVDDEINTSTALVTLHADAANSQVPKMKNASRLKTERLVYVLPDGHPLLTERDHRQEYDPSPYLLVVWTKGELESYDEFTKNNLEEEENDLTVPGTLLIPCRTAMQGRFPLNGTYFQINEVFADYASMINPFNVPRKWIWNLETRTTYFGTGVSSIMKGLSMDEIRSCFCRGFICVRAMDAKTKASRPISSILHRNTTAKVGKSNKNKQTHEE